MKCDTFIPFLLSVITLLVGDINFPLKAVVAMMILDMVTGVLSNWGNWQSGIAWQGITRKIGTLCLIAVCNLAGEYLGQPLRDMVIAFYIFSECVSVMENVRKMGVDIPEFLDRLLNKILADTEQGGK